MDDEDFREYFRTMTSNPPPYSFIPSPDVLQQHAETCLQAERNMQVMMSQWEIAIVKIEKRFQQVEKMVEELKKMHSEAEATRDDMNTFLSFVKIPELPKEGGEETS